MREGMRLKRAMRVLGLTAILVAGAWSAAGSVFGGAAADPQPSYSVINSLDCGAPPEFIELFVGSIGNPTSEVDPVDRSTREEAFSDFARYADLREPEAFTESASGEGSAQFVLHRNGSLKASVFLEQRDDDWFVSDYAACPSEFARGGS